jgi:plasmid stabilization system protein ParE
MNKFPEDAPRRYVVVDSDPYDSDRDAFYLYLNRTLGPDYAARWLDDLEVAVEDLTGFPGPLSHARDEDATDHYGREVRRLLYYGPTRKRSGTPVRILFTILPPDPAAPPEEAESVIFLLRLLHGAQRLLPEDEA